MLNNVLPSVGGDNLLVIVVNQSMLTMRWPFGRCCTKCKAYYFDLQLWQMAHSCFQVGPEPKESKIYNTSPTVPSQVVQVKRLYQKHTDADSLLTTNNWWSSSSSGYRLYLHAWTRWVGDRRSRSHGWRTKFGRNNQIGEFYSILRCE